MAVRRGLRSYHGLGRKPSQLDRESGLGGGGTAPPASSLYVELDNHERAADKYVGKLAFEISTPY